MTTRQPEALRLAEILECGYSLAWLYERGGYEVSAELRRQQARITDLEAQLEAIGAGGVSGPLIGQPQAMPDLSQLTERGAKAWAGVDAQGLREGFTAADMATVSAQGFRDGVASLSANAGEPRNAIDRDALIAAITQGLHGTWHCTRVWEAWHVGTMSQDDFEPVDESETPTEIADAVLALLAAPPAAQAEGWMDIETAPKDGQAILVTDGMDCYCVEWDEEFDWWTVDDNKLGPFRLRGSAPTHWMPLPAAPGPADGESK